MKPPIPSGAAAAPGPSRRRERRMKVAVVTVQFPVPSEVFASNDVRTLREQGVEVEVHALRRPHPRMREMLRERGLEDLRVEHSSVAAGLRGLAVALARPRALLEAVRWTLRHHRGRQRLLSLLLLPRAFDVLRRLERGGVDVVHAYWSHYPSLVVHLVQRWRPATVSSVSFVLYDLTMRYGGSAPVARRADLVRTVAACNVPEVAAHTGVAPERVEVIYDGLDLARIDALARGVERRPKRLVAAGRLVPHKGVDDVLRAFARVAARIPEATLTVLGDGPERERLERLAASLGVRERTEFRGHVSHDEVIRELAAAEVFLLLSETERIANVVKEALACGCVPVVTRTDGLDELLDDGREGFVVDWRDPAAAAERALRVLEGGVDRAAMAAAGRARVERDFDVRRCVARYVTRWRAALAGRRGAREATAEAAAAPTRA